MSYAGYLDIFTGIFFFFFLQNCSGNNCQFYSVKMTGLFFFNGVTNMICEFMFEGLFLHILIV